MAVSLALRDSGLTLTFYWGDWLKTWG